MSELFSQLISRLTPKYTALKDGDKEWSQDCDLKTHQHQSEPEPQQTPNLPTVHTPDLSVPHTTPDLSAPHTDPDLTTTTHYDTHYTEDHECEYVDVNLDDGEEDCEEEVKVHKTKDNVNLITEKKAIGLDLFPPIEEILFDHGLKDKLKQFSLAVRGKTANADAQTPEQKAEKPSSDKISNFEYLKNLRFPGPTSNKLSKLYPDKENNKPAVGHDNRAVQTYYPDVCS